MGFKENRLRRGVMMNKPLLRYVLSPLATALALVIIHLASGLHWFTVSLAFPVGVMAICLFWSGLRANVISAALVTLYALTSPYFDLVRSAQVILLAAWPMAIIGGIMRRWLIEQVAEAERQRQRAAENQAKADFVDDLNGNIETIREINQELVELTNAVPALSTAQIQIKLSRTQNKAANLALRTMGWHQLAQEKKDYLADKEK